MLKLFYASTTPSLRVILLLEELGLDYKKLPINVFKKQTLNPEYGKIVPTKKTPAIIEDGEVMFDSANILLYLAQKHNKCLGDKNQKEAISWFFWGTSDLNPKFIQYLVEAVYTPNPNPDFLAKIKEQLFVLLGVLDNQLSTKDYIAGANYSIADINIYATIQRYLIGNFIPNLLADFPNIQAWVDRIGVKASVKKAYELEASFDKEGEVTDTQIKDFFNS